MPELSYQEPFRWRELFAFLAPRAVPGVETVEAGVYRRNICFDAQLGRLEARPHPTLPCVRIEVDAVDPAHLRAISERVRGLLDLDSDPTEVQRVLEADPLLAPLAARRHGLRLPGAWDGFELAVRAILGQQVTVRGATTLCGRLVEQYGRAIPGGFLFPEPQTLARARFTRVGLPRARARALRALARACADRELRLQPGADPAATRAALERLPGIGDWTAQYVSMRALGDADAFPAGDLGLLQAAGRLLPPASKPLRPADLRRLAEAWRPWRAYAAMHLWQSLSDRSAAPNR